MPDRIIEHIHAHAATWRREIVQARIRLADAGLSAAERAALWRLVDHREACLRKTVRDFAGELERIDCEIENALRR